MKYYSGEDFEVERLDLAIQDYQVQLFNSFVFSLIFAINLLYLITTGAFLIKQNIIFFQKCEWDTIASLALLNTAQNSVITAGLLAGTLYCGKLVVEGQLGVSTTL